MDTRPVKLRRKRLIPHDAPWISPINPRADEAPAADPMAWLLILLFIAGIGVGYLIRMLGG